MDALVNTTPPDGGKPITMSSREIAELTGKRHDHVKRDIEKMLEELGEDIPKFGGIYLDSMNREQMEYLLDRDLTENLLMGYSPILRRKVLQRMRELEAALSQRIPTTAEAFANAFRMLADNERRQAQHSVKLAAIDTRLAAIEDTAPLKAKPQNAETISEIRKRMNKRFGLPERIVNDIMVLGYAPNGSRICTEALRDGEEQSRRSAGLQLRRFLDQGGYRLLRSFRCGVRDGVSDESHASRNRRKISVGQGITATRLSRAADVLSPMTSKICKSLRDMD